MGEKSTLKYDDNLFINKLDQFIIKNCVKSLDHEELNGFVKEQKNEEIIN